MGTDRLFENIFQHPDLLANPPVLLDIGASGSLHSNWKSIAKYSICVAFDADEREMEFIDNKVKEFRQLHIVNKIVTDQEPDKAQFYLTSSPYCSSLLRPDSESLEEWSFSELFKTERSVELPAITLQKALNDLGIDRVDWFKCDTQGLDLKLFKNMEHRQQSTIVADFEPGFIDAYIGEDKISHLLDHMETLPYWLCYFAPGSNQRVNLGMLRQSLSAKEVADIKHATTAAVVYAEVTYINNFKQPEMQTERNYLLGCVFALILKQYGFAAELALKGVQSSNHALFNQVLQYIKETTQKPTLKRLITDPTLLKKKILRKVVHKMQRYLND